MVIETEKQTELENLKADVEKTLNLYESYISGSANRTRQMIENKGIKKTLEELVQSSECQQGFRKLHECNKLNESFEALVLKHKSLFSENIVECAKFRLNNPDALKNIKFGK